MGPRRQLLSEVTHRRARLGQLIALVALLVGSDAAASIVGSKHDLSANGGGMWNAPSQSQVCVFCHVPHNADPLKPALWNREDRVAAYTLYSGTDRFFAIVNQPQRESLMCLSCHDGITALNALVQVPQGGVAMDASGDQLGDIYYPGSFAGMGPNTGGNADDLSDDHPVSFTFDAQLVAQDGGIKLPSAGGVVKLFGPSRDQLECTTCHDPHNTAYPRFLVMSNQSSALCLSCHIR